MHNVLLVLQREIKTTLGERSFWVATFVLPVVFFAFIVGSQFLAARMAMKAVVEETSAEETVTEGLLIEGSSVKRAPPVSRHRPKEEEEEELVAIEPTTGYVDEAGIIATFPEDFPEDLLGAYPDRETAQAALQAGDLTSYYVVPADFAQSPDLILVQRQFSPIQLSDREENDFHHLVLYNLTGSVEVARTINSSYLPVRLERVAPPETVPASGSHEASVLVPFFVGFVFFLSLTMSSEFLLRSVSKEKENRMVEVLLLSLHPRELMLGKLLGLSIVALVQLLLWLGAGALVMGSDSPLFRFIRAASSFSLPPGFFAWGLIYFLLSFLMFSSILGAIGALAPSAREGSQFTSAVLLPLMIAMGLNAVFSDAPNRLLLVLLSLFPLTSPVSMMARLAATSVPLWQLLVSVALLAATAYGFVLASARFFRADTLLSSTSLSWKRLQQEVKRAVS